MTTEKHPTVNPKLLKGSTNPMQTTPDVPAPQGEIVLFARVGSQRISFTAHQLRDTVASYLARGNTMPAPTDINRGDPNEPLHVIVEEWLYGNVDSWVNGADVVHLEHYRHHAVQWIRSHFGPTMAGLDDQPTLPKLEQHAAP
ncbi:MAG: hypothetical protein JO287_09670 [Pseudonocardiales bacterium]|nr:hypothetical protein [Pseudonocardiales bacterium]